MTSLALFGGTPVRTDPFPAWPRLTPELEERVLSTLRTDRWGVGSKAVAEFEEAFARFQEAAYCTTVSTGTSALWVALKAAGIQAGEEVIVPAYTFIATASAVILANAVPVFIDIDPETLNMDPDLIEAAITSKTRAIIPVHVGGNPADMDRILEIARRHDLKVIEDAAQAHGAEWNHQKVGALGLGGVFSFQSSKNMTAGEGGAIVTNDASFAEACFSYHNCGRVKGKAWYRHDFLGGNFRLNGVAASLLLGQLDTLEADMRLRDRNRKKLNKILGEIPGLTPVKTYPETTRQSHHLYILRYHADQFHGIPRNVFFKAMQAEGIFTYGGYTPLYRENLFITNTAEYPWLAEYDYGQISMPVTEKIADREAVWLRQNHLLGDERDIQDIVNAFEKVTTALKREPELFKDLNV
jgi:dTDP-4-amino-4,6-dideoxygalactose transaminase